MSGDSTGEEPSGAEPTTHSDYTVDVTPSVDTPDETVTIDGHEYLITETGKVRPGNDVTIAVDAPSSTSDYEIQLRERDTEFIRRDSDQQTGDSSVTFDTGETASKPPLEPRTYGAIAKVGDTLAAVQPVVVTGYRVSVIAPDTAEETGGIRVSASLTECDTDEPIPAIDEVEVVDWEAGTNDQTRTPMTTTGPATYATTLDRPAGEYRLAVVVLGVIAEDVIEPIGFSEPRDVAVVDGTYGLSPAWAVQTGSRLQFSRPGVDSETLYVGGLRQSVTANERASQGSEHWSFQRAGALSDSSPVVTGGTVYVGSGGGVVYALDAAASATDRVVWEAQLDSAVTATPAVADGTVFAATNDGRVRAFDASNGNTRWTTTVGGPVFGALATGTDRVFLTTNDGDVVALDHDGAEAWRYATGQELGAASPVHANGSVFVAADAVRALDATDGTQQWQVAAYEGGVGSTPAVDGGTVYVGGADWLFRAVDATDGAELWSFGLGAAVACRPGLTSDRVVVADLSGTVVVLDRATGDWLDAAALGTPVRSPIVVDGGDVVVGTRAGDVEVFTNIP